MRPTRKAQHSAGLSAPHRGLSPLRSAGLDLVDTDARYLYYVLPDKKAIRYGVTVGEEAQAWSGIAKVGSKEEWPSWIPTAR